MVHPGNRSGQCTGKTDGHMTAWEQGDHTTDIPDPVRRAEARRAMVDRRSASRRIAEWCNPLQRLLEASIVTGSDAPALLSIALSAPKSTPAWRHLAWQ